MTNYRKILVFDFETTGLSPLNDRVIEIGALLLEKQDNIYLEKENLSILINPGFNLHPKITEITGITDELLKNEGIPEEIAFNRLSSLIDDNTLLVAYNLAFDIGFLVNLFRRYVNRSYVVPNDILDVMAVYKDRHPFPHKLSDAASKYMLTNEGAHRAIEDVKCTFRILVEMLKENNNINKYINVLGFNPKYRQPNTFWFQKPIKLVSQGFNGQGEIEKSS